ncbi:MAG TPA: hypothetical protein VLY03_01325 [Bacteroidota bacterium]|nr:hypothetical protein [Bacteroidota bacterium]
MDKSEKFLDRSKAWLEGFASRPRALWLLFLVSFAEASLFPISVDVPLIALGVSAPRNGLRLGSIATLGSFLGGYLGYWIGLAFYERIGSPLLELYGLSRNFAALLAVYHQHGIGALILSGFTPLPYISFTYAAGFNRTLDLGMLTVGAFIGRTLRFFSIGVLLYVVGPKAKGYLEKYFSVVAVSFVLLVLGGIALFRWLL